MEKAIMKCNKTKQLRAASNANNLKEQLCQSAKISADLTSDVFRQVKL